MLPAIPPLPVLPVSSVLSALPPDPRASIPLSVDLLPSQATNTIDKLMQARLEKMLRMGAQCITDRK
jgi:hypothetical protein